MRTQRKLFGAIGLVFIFATCQESAIQELKDEDKDGYNSSTDCDDNDPNVHPGATEICNDDKDNDCSAGDVTCLACQNGSIPVSGCVCDGQDRYSGYCCDNKHQNTACNGVTDNDQDNFDNTVDCDDNNPNIHPGAQEKCGNGIDEDCDPANDGCLDCTVGQPVPNMGCDCEGNTYYNGYCCQDGWQGTVCGFTPKRCQDIAAVNCIEVWPNEQKPGYEYHANHRTYFFRDLSNQDHYFLLMGDLECDKTCAVFGFPDGTPDTDASTTFDLNGYTLTYSAADYPSIANNGFEQWQGNNPIGWKVVSGAVEPRSTDYWMPMSGQQVLYTENAVVLESSPITLSTIRVYQGYVTVGRAAASDIKLDVIDSNDEVACSQTKAGFKRGQSFACRFTPKAGSQYRLRLTTAGYAYFDKTGIVPINDYGVGVFTSWSLNPSNPSQNPIVQNLANLDIPASGDTASPTRYNHLEVMNGRIIAGHENQISTGVYLSGIVRLHLHHVTVVANGLKSHSVRAYGEIHHNHLEVDMPWYFARENSDEENVILEGGKFYDNLAIGGQGVLRLGGNGTQVYNNTFRNNAQATNHYAIIHEDAVAPEIYNNVFDPFEGSGILTYSGHGYKIHDNTFYVRTAPCNVEYINEDYSTNGVRMNDYKSGKNYDNWVYNNRFYITGDKFDTAWENCMPVTTGIFYSASGVNNRIFGNYFEIIKTHDDDNAPMFAIYMGDGYNNPEDNPLIKNNTFETNDKAIWISSYYGDTEHMWLENNTFVRLDNEFYQPKHPKAAIRMGYWSYYADNIRLINNHFQGGFEPGEIHFSGTSENGAYDLATQWYLHVTVRNSSNQLVENALVKASAINGSEVVEARTNADGIAVLTLTQYKESGDMRPAGVHQRDMVTPHSLLVEHNNAGATISSILIDKETFIEVEIN